MFRQVAGSSPSAPAPAPVLCPLDPLPISLSSYLSLYSHPDIHSSLKRNVQDCWTTIFMYAFPIYRDSSGLEIPNLTPGGTFTQRKEGIFTCTYLQEFRLATGLGHAIVSQDIPSSAGYCLVYTAQHIMGYWRRGKGDGSCI